jgi:hypothetical protein
VVTSLLTSLDIENSCHITTDIHSATDPDPRTVVNKTDPRWIAYYVMRKEFTVRVSPFAHNLAVYLIGFVLGCVNIFMWYRYCAYAYGWYSNDGPTRVPYRRAGWGNRSRAFNVSVIGMHILIILPFAIFMCLGPFFSPWLGLKIAQRLAWIHRCDDYAVEVVLGGVANYSPTSEPAIASFYFWQNKQRVKFFDFNLTQSQDDATVWDFALGQVETGANIPPQAYPLIQTVTYNFTAENGALSAMCTASPDTPTAEATPCMVGSFDAGSSLSFTTNDTRTDTVTVLQAATLPWFFPADAPNFILKEIQPNSGQVAVRTAVTKPGQCQVSVCMVQHSLPNNIGFPAVPQGLPGERDRRRHARPSGAHTHEAERLCDGLLDAEQRLGYQELPSGLIFLIFTDFWGGQSRTVVGSMKSCVYGLFHGSHM